MPFRFGPWEIGIILLIILIVFGAGKLPQVGSSIGKAIRDFRKETSRDNVNSMKSLESARQD